MLAITRPIRRAGVGAWLACLDCEAGGEWVRLRLRARDGSAAASSDLAFARAALAIANALLEALASRDTTAADAAELLQRACLGDVDAMASLEQIATDAPSDDRAADALATIFEAHDAAELLELASSGDGSALEALGTIASAADRGDPEALRAERALTTPSLVGGPTLDLGTLDLVDGSSGALRRLHNALAPVPLHVRGATVTMRAIGRAGGAT